MTPSPSGSLPPEARGSLRSALGPDMHRPYHAIKEAGYASVAPVASNDDYDLYLPTV